MDFSKTYDCLPHDLLVGKSEAYGINKTCLNLIHNYLSKRKQRNKINSLYSDWYDIVRGVPKNHDLSLLLLKSLFKVGQNIA